MLATNCALAVNTCLPLYNRMRVIVVIVVGMENAKSNIHSTAIVHPNAKLGKDVIVGPGAVIGEHVEIGDGTQIGAHVVIGGWTTIGKRCEIYPNASIGLEPQDLKFKRRKKLL